LANKQPPSRRPTADRGARVERRSSAPLYGLFFLSGAAALAYEVLWMPRFAVLLGATAPVEAAALAAFFTAEAANRVGPQ
jgi:hypothetical protein